MRGRREDEGGARLRAALIAVAVALALAVPPAPADATEATSGDSLESQVVRGEVSGDGAWPFMVALVSSGDRDDDLFCGGTLLDARWVLTAAHCLDGESASSVHVVAGTQDLTDGDATRVPVAGAVRHPRYVEDRLPDYDAALLRLTRPVDQPTVTLATAAAWEARAPGVAARTVGWGASDPEATEFGPQLREGVTAVLADRVCEQGWGSQHSLDQAICAGLAGQGACTGDSGGPLVAPAHAGGDWVQSGIVSIGLVTDGDGTEICGRNPGLYVDVATLLPWLEAETGLSLGSGEPMRVGHDDVYRSAAAITRHAYAGPQETVHVASAEAFADGLTGGALAAVDGPLLLVPEEGPVPEAIHTELSRLAPRRIVAFGGEAAIAGDTVEDLGVHAPVTRLAGADRYETAIEIARAWGSTDKVYVATGENYPDALAAAPLAAFRGPIVLVRKDSVPVPTSGFLAALAPSEVVILGGSSAVSEAVGDRLAAVSGGDVRRISGADRYATAAAVATDRDNWTDPPFAYVAAGGDYRDALVGGVAAAYASSPLLLTRGDAVDPVVGDALARLDPVRTVVVGGEAAIDPPTARVLHDSGRR